MRTAIRSWAGAFFLALPVVAQISTGNSSGFGSSSSGSGFGSSSSSSGFGGSSTSGFGGNSNSGFGGNSNGGFGGNSNSGFGSGSGSTSGSAFTTQSAFTNTNSSALGNTTGSGQQGSGINGSGGANGSRGGLSALSGLAGRGGMGGGQFGNNSSNNRNRAPQKVGAQRFVHAVIQADFSALPPAPPPQAVATPQAVVASLAQALPSLAGVNYTMAADGTATLTGTVATERERRIAMGLLELEPGVRKVDNQLTVSGAAPGR